jgi:hypothetical protein
LQRISLYGIEASFLPGEEKEQMKTVFTEEWQQIVSVD